MSINQIIPYEEHNSHYNIVAHYNSVPILDTKLTGSNPSIESLLVLTQRH